MRIRYWLIGLVGVFALISFNASLSRSVYAQAAAPSFIDELRTKAEAGDAVAQNNLGRMYAKGQGVPKDYAIAVSWYRKAAQQGDTFAQNNLGRMYAKGQGVPKDYAIAVSWYRKAAQQGDAFAQNNLGNMYAKGQGVLKDYAIAVSWYRKAAQQGDTFAQNNLGNMYVKGQGVPKDYAIAVSWYCKAAQQGDTFAQNNLGNMYAEDQGVSKDDTMAVLWYCKVVEGKNIPKKSINADTKSEYTIIHRAPPPPKDILPPLPDGERWMSEGRLKYYSKIAVEGTTKVAKKIATLKGTMSNPPTSNEKSKMVALERDHQKLIDRSEDIKNSLAHIQNGGRVSRRKGGIYTAYPLSGGRVSPSP